MSEDKANLKDILMLEIPSWMDKLINASRELPSVEKLDTEDQKVFDKVLIAFSNSMESTMEELIDEEIKRSAN